MEKVYLKFRLEVLPGNYLLFQDLFLDPRFDNSAIFVYPLDDSIPREYMKRFYNGEGGKDCIYIGKNKPQIIISKNAIEHKDYLLKQLNEFWKWEGFTDDFYKPNIEIFKPTTYLNVNNEICFLSDLGLNAERFIFRKHSDVANGYDIFLDYQIWERNEFTFMKVNYAADYFRIYSFSNKEIDDNIINSPFIYPDEIKFKGTLPEYDFNVVGTYNFRVDIDDINNQVLKFLNEKFKPKQPELEYLGNNIYEVRG